MGCGFSLRYWVEIRNFLVIFDDSDSVQYIILVTIIYTYSKDRKPENTIEIGCKSRPSWNKDIQKNKTGYSNLFDKSMAK